MPVASKKSTQKIKTSKKPKKVISRKSQKKPVRKSAKKGKKKPIKTVSNKSSDRIQEVDMANKNTLKKIKNIQKKMIELRRRNDSHFGNSTLVQPLNKTHFIGNDLSDKLPRNSGIILFYANWCPHCHSIVPIMNELAEKMNDNDRYNKMMVGAIDCAKPDNDNISSDMNVMGYPTIKIFQNGKFVGDYDGPREVPFMTTVLDRL